jgi:hypothetical protein
MQMPQHAWARVTTGAISEMFVSQKALVTVPCPKCTAKMILAVITPHPISAKMERHTFLCEKCNQTKTYMLQAQ